MAQLVARRRRITVLLFILSVLIWTPIGAEALANALAGPAPETYETRPGTAAPGAGAMAVRPEPRPQLPVAAPPQAKVVPVAAVPEPVATRTPASKTPKPAQPPAASTAAPAAVASVPAAASKPVDLTVVTETWFRNSGTEPVNSGTATLALRALPQSRDIVLLEETITPTPSRVSLDESGNRVAEFDLTGIRPGGQLTVRQEYRIRVWGYGGGGKDGRVLAIHLAPEYKIESDAPEIRQLAAALTAGKSSVEAKLRAIFAGVRQRLSYSLSSPARNQGALAALQAGSGVCEEFASLFVALARASDIPARLVIGYGRSATSVKGAWGSAGMNLSKYKHAWAEAYLPEYGWAAFDPTLGRAAIPGVAQAGIPSGILIQETYKNRGLTTVYSGGRIEANWRQTVAW